MAIRQSIAKQFVNTSSAFNASFAAATLAGSTVLVVLNGYDGGGTVTATCSDDKSGGTNTYTQVASTDAAARVLFYYSQNAGACQQITLTPGGNINGFWQAFEITAPASSVDGAAAFYSDADSSPNASVTSATPTQTGDIAFAACCTRENFGTFTLAGPSGWTSDHLDTTQVGASISSSIAHKTADASAQTATWTHGTGSPGAAGVILFLQNGASILLRMVNE